MNVSLSYSKQLSVNISDNILSVDIKYMISILFISIIILNQFIMYEMYLSYMSSEYVILYFKCNAP